MKIKKGYVIILTIVILYFVLMYFLFMRSSPQMIPTSGEITIILSPNTVWRYRNNRWKEISSENSIQNQYYDLYIDNKLIGNYELGYMDDSWRYYPNENCLATDINCVDKSLINENFIAITGDRDISVVETNKETLEKSDKYVKQVLQELGLKESNYLSIEKISIDYDNDKQNEMLYAVDNVFQFNDDVSKYYSIVFVVDKEEVRILSKNITSSEYDNCSISISNILNLSTNKKYSVITKCMYNDMIGSCHEMFELKQGNFVKVMSCDTPSL